MDRISIRPIDKTSELEAREYLFRMVKQLFKASISEKYHGDIIKLDETYIQEPRHILYGAFNQEGTLIGTIGIKKFVDRFPVLEGRYKEEKTCEIVRCYLEEDYRRRGIGSSLFKELMDFASRASYEKIYLHTHRHLPGGFDFWLARGFEITVEDTDIDKTVHMEYRL